METKQKKLLPTTVWGCSCDQVTLASRSEARFVLYGQMCAEETRSREGNRVRRQQSFESSSAASEKDGRARLCGYLRLYC